MVPFAPLQLPQLLQLTSAVQAKAVVALGACVIRAKRGRVGAATPTMRQQLQVSLQFDIPTQ